MKAMFYDAFRKAPEITTLADPTPTADGVVIKVGATGLCRSDWHGWMGHDPDIRLPHVPGHELAGEVVAAGRDVRRFRVGDRVTVPFVSGCGRCAECRSGNQQVCPDQFQPGFTHWGSFAEYVAIGYADTNLVPLPEEIDDATAASLGCRFATSFRAVADQARTGPGEWIAVHGCGGVGLSAIMIATALGASAIGIDLSDDKLELARQCRDDQCRRGGRRGRGGARHHRRRRACVDRCARPSFHLFQLDPQSAAPWPACSGGPDAGGRCNTANPDGAGDRP